MFVHRKSSLKPRVDKTGQQDNDNQSNTEQSNSDHYCGLTTMEGSVTALPVVAVKIKVRGSPLCIKTYSLLDNGCNSTICLANFLEHRDKWKENKTQADHHAQQQKCR